MACLKEMCRYSKNLYNQTLFEMNRYYKDTGKTLTAFGVHHILKESPNKKMLPAQSAGYVYKQVEDARKSWFQSLKSYAKNPSAFNGRPRPPRYLDKEGFNRVTFTPAHFCKRPEGKVALTVQKKLKKKYSINELLVTVPKHIDVDALKLITVLPGEPMRIQFTYDVPNMEVTFAEGSFVAIDMGVSNLCACIDNVTDSPIIVSGKRIKHILWQHNKDVARLKAIVDKCEKVDGRGGRSTRRIKRLYEKRNNRIKYELHDVSNRIIRHCIENRIGTIVIGQNKGWKQNADFGKANNQTFSQMPIAILIHYLEYKGELAGIDVVCVDEAYTSKCDALALESVGKHEEYMGNRVKRGLFQSSTGKLINADINGAINIARKQFGESIDEWVKSLGNSVCNPRVIKSNRDVSSETSECTVRFAPKCNKGVPTGSTKLA